MNEHFPGENPFRTSMLEEADGPGHNTSANPTMGEIISARFSRRGFLKGSLAVSAIATTVSPLALLTADEARAATGSAFNFSEVEAGIDETHHVAEGYDADILLRWGDAIFADSPAFDPTAQTADAQRRQFGYNNDFVGFIPLEGSADRGLLVVNHEYTNPHLMFPGMVTINADKEIEVAPLTKEQVDIEIAAHGGAIVEIVRENGKWRVVPEGQYNRRITADTEMEVTGPAAGHARLQTSADPTGTKVFGTINNCAGGVTPWGTYILAEENSTATSGANFPPIIRRRRTTGATGSPKGPTSGRASTTGSTYRKNRTRPTASATSSKSIRWIPTRLRRSALRSAASSTKAPSRSSTAMAGLSSTSATTSASTMSTSS
jgi:uncharacterized protein